MRKCLLLITMVAISTPVFSATLKSLNKEQITNAFVGKTAVSVKMDDFEGHLGSNTFSMYLDGKGNIKGKLSSKVNNEPQTDTGVYVIEKDGTGYFTWQHWYGAKKICFRIFNTENAYLSVDCSNLFHTVYMKNAIKTGEQLG
ncbi:MAG: hypothetical protein JSR33_07350 [Proteobacteria bacterium]|nr:hypothetical protein [Pseudomonadota bacterium]